MAPLSMAGALWARAAVLGKRLTTGTETHTGAEGMPFRARFADYTGAESVLQLALVKVAIMLDPRDAQALHA